MKTTKTTKTNQTFFCEIGSKESILQALTSARIAFRLTLAQHHPDDNTNDCQYFELHAKSARTVNAAKTFIAGYMCAARIEGKSPLK